MDRGKLTQKQLVFMSSTYIFGTMFITLPRMLTDVAMHTGWLCIIIAMVLFTGYSYLINKVIKEMKNSEFIPFVHSFLGKWMGPPVTLVLLLIPTLFYSAYVMRLIVELFSTLVIPETPIEVLMIMILILRYWTVHGGIRSVGLLAELLLPAITLVIISMLLMSSAQMDISSIMPFFDTGLMGILRGSTSVFSNFMEIGILFYVASRIQDSHKTGRSLLWVNIAVGSMFLATYWICLGAFGTAYTKRLAFPTIEMVRNISFANSFEHVEIIFLTMWVFMTLVKGSMTYYACCVGFQSWFGLKSYKQLMIPLLVITYFLASIPQNLLQAVFRFEQFKNAVYPYYGITSVLLLYGLIHLRNRKKEA